MIETIYGVKDRNRGSAASYQWFIEEAGELARAIRKGEPKNLREEFADVFAWLATLANMCGVNLEEAVNEKYPGSCIKCGACPCACVEKVGHP